MATALSLAHHERIKSAYETAVNRLRSIRQHGERTIERTVAVAATNSAAAAFGYVNERYGKAPDNDPGGYPEHTVLGVPTDLAAGGLTLGATFFGIAGRYDHLVMSVGNGAMSAFSYRFGADFARKHKKKEAAPGKHTASGAASPWAHRGAVAP